MFDIVLYLLMDTRDFQSFVQLFDRMEADSSLKGAGRQLSCIAKLIFYCGVKEGEIPELTIRDVIDQDGNIIRVIRKFEKTHHADRRYRALHRKTHRGDEHPESVPCEKKESAFSIISQHQKNKTSLENIRDHAHSNPSCGHPLLLPEGIGGRQVKGMDIRERQQTEADINKAVSSGCTEFENPSRCVS